MADDFGERRQEQFVRLADVTGLNLLRRQCRENGLSPLGRRRQDARQNARFSVIQLHKSTREGAQQTAVTH
ncbi:hypothetical protein V8F63_03055 [Brevundimonas sp. LF-1]|uniref:hypothetical protein n=1 Tax=Brevundimonas sp. LF-1 TaxID=3126100 RepID=UPI0030E1C670